MYNYYQTTPSSVYDYSTTSTVTLDGFASIWLMIALIASIVGAILVFVLFVRPKTEPKGKFAKWLKDFLAFRILWIEPILKMVYYFLTIFCVVGSFAFITVSPVYFLALLIGGPIGIRLGYELIMIFIGIWRNTREMADNTKKPGIHQGPDAN